ncbi:unannotated protein [freshwater metagenome]|uniref:Unannotated protein n=1 Tax=freshwater metagenome TaxID=449393 RepID=A0A6J7J9M6_9ZZZZ
MHLTVADDLDPGDATCLDQHARHRGQRRHGGPGAGAHRVEVGERGVPALTVDDVDRCDVDSRGTVEVVEVVASGEPCRDAGGDEGPLEGLHLVVGVAGDAHALARRVEMPAELGGRPAREPGSRPRVVVADPAHRLAAAVVGGAAPDHAGAVEGQQAPGVARTGVAPVVRQRQRGRVEQVGGPARRAMGAVVGARLDHEHGAVAPFEEPSRHDRPGRAGAHDHDVDRRRKRRGGLGGDADQSPRVMVRSRV